MRDKPFKLPFYAKAAIFFIGLFVFIAMLYLGRSIIVPVLFALIIAIVLHPVVGFFMRRKINRTIAAIFTLALAFLVIAAFTVLLVSQASRLAESWPELVSRFATVLDQAITWASGRFNIDPQSVRDWIAKTQGELVNTSGAAIGQTIINVGNLVVVLLLLPVYVFLILFYQPLLLTFIRTLFLRSNQKQVSEIVTQIKGVIQRYLVGLVIEFVIVSSLNTASLFILGIDYAILLGVVGGLLNLVPFVGGILAVALPVMIALATKPTALYALYVLAAYSAIQLFDNNYIIPKIVASKVKINALFSIIVVIAGNALWGIPGMFVSIPLLAIVKVVFDHIEPLKPWGYLLGDTLPRLKIVPILRRLRDRTVGRRRVVSSSPAPQFALRPARLHISERRKSEPGRQK